jgi:hypothetical protein
MRLRPAVGLLFLVAAATLGASSPARAWTRTVVHSARATVEVEREATLYVLLRLDVEVHAGWLHELELVDLGPNVELDRYRPPYFRSEEGEVFRPEAELHEDGRIRLWFHRREAPRRGEYRVFMRYRTDADARAVEVEGEPRARVVWSMPAWETGLHDVSVELRAPKGTVVPDEARDNSPGVDFQVTERPNRTILQWRRIHLPRMTAWPLMIDAPAESIALPAVAEAAPIPSGFRPLQTPEERPIAWAILATAVLALIKRRTIEKSLGQQHLLLRAPWPPMLAATALVVASAQWLGPTELAFGLPLVALALQRPRASMSRAPASKWSNVRFASLSVAQRPDFLDATTPFGATTLAACTACLFALGQPAGALLLLPVFLLCTRHHRLPTAQEATATLASFAKDLRIPPDAPPMCFSWEHADDGFPRLRVHLPSGRSGLQSVAFAVTASSLGLLRPRNVMLLVQTRAQSDADDLMRRRMRPGEDFRQPDGGITRVVPWDADAVELLRVLACKAPKPVKASRGTWLLREISDSGRKAA